MRSITRVQGTYWIDFKTTPLGMPYETNEENEELIEECLAFFKSVHIRRCINSIHLYFVPATQDGNALMYAFIYNHRGIFELKGLLCTQFGELTVSTASILKSSMVS